MDEKKIDYQATLEVIMRLLEVSREHNEAFKEPIVMVGGNAMMAHNIRKQSDDVDLYVAEFSDDVIHQVEEEFKSKFGERFRIDVTSVENIWGDIMLRDIKNSEPISKIKFENSVITIQRMGIEDLFLLKLDAGRNKDADDLPILFERTTVPKLIERFNTILKWHGNRDAILGYADKFVSTVAELGNQEPMDIISKLKLSEFMIEALKETYSLDEDDRPRP